MDNVSLFGQRHNEIHMWRLILSGYFVKLLSIFCISESIVQKTQQTIRRLMLHCRRFPILTRISRKVFSAQFSASWMNLQFRSLFCLLWWSFWFTVQTNINLMKKFFFSDKPLLFEIDLFRLSNYFRRRLSSLRETVALDWFLRHRRIIFPLVCFC